VGNLWALATFVGPILLGAVILWAILRNRKRETPSDIARSDAGTRDLYASEDRDDHERDVQR
jgi:hypothetical protein